MNFDPISAKGIQVTKHERINQLLEEQDLDGLIIQQIANFAWATDGASSYINTATTNGVATLIVTRDAKYLIADNIESPRFENEEQLKKLENEIKKIGRRKQKYLKRIAKKINK